MRLTTRNEYTGKAILIDLPNYEEYDPIERLAEYEDIGANPDELKTAVYLYLEMSQKMRRIVKDMKWYLDANEEDGVVYIPKFVIEEIAYGK